MTGTENRAADNAELIGLIDRLEALLNSSELSEIEIEAGETALVLRKPAALAGNGSPAVAAPGAAAVATPQGAESAQPAVDDPPPNAVLAPLTGLFYSSPSPGAQAYTTVGSQITVGQVIGLIEAMKLFNEIKSDVTGTVKRIAVESGALVKARQTLIEVEPA